MTFPKQNFVPTNRSLSHAVRYPHFSCSHGANRFAAVLDPCSRFSAICCRRCCRRSFLVQTTDSRSLSPLATLFGLSSSSSVCFRCVPQRLLSSPALRLGAVKVPEPPIFAAFYLSPIVDKLEKNLLFCLNHLTRDICSQRFRAPPV